MQIIFGGHGVCYNNTFSNNYMCSLNRNSEWVIGMSLLSNCNVYIVNNTITNVYDGIRGLGSKLNSKKCYKEYRKFRFIC